MKIRPLYIAFIAFFAVAAAGCNSDIFIDGPDVTYTGAEASGYMLFHNKILDRQIIEKFKVRSLYPVSYEIRIEDAK